MINRTVKDNRKLVNGIKSELDAIIDAMNINPKISEHEIHRRLYATIRRAGYTLNITAADITDPFYD